MEVRGRKPIATVAALGSGTISAARPAKKMLHLLSTTFCGRRANFRRVHRGNSARV
jgi:hypothetical protein